VIEKRELFEQRVTAALMVGMRTLRLLAIPKLVATKDALATKRKATRTAAPDAANQWMTAEVAIGVNAKLSRPTESKSISC
jgi:hypothetical protein